MKSQCGHCWLHGHNRRRCPEIATPHEQLAARWRQKEFGQRSKSERVLCSVLEVIGTIGEADRERILLEAYARVRKQSRLDDSSRAVN